MTSSTGFWRLKSSLTLRTRSTYYPRNMKHFIMLALAGAALSLGACATTTTGPYASPKQKAEAAIRNAEVAATPITTALVSTSLVLIKDPARRGDIAQKIVAASNAVDALLTGKVPTAEELKAQVKAYVGNDPEALRIAQVIAANYASIYPLFSIAEKSPVVFIGKVTKGARDGAAMFGPASTP